MAKVITVILYDVIDSMVSIEHYSVREDQDLLDRIKENPLHSGAKVLYYNEKYQLAFAVCGV